MKVIEGHTGSVLCLQFDDKVIVTGSVDTTIKLVSRRVISLAGQTHPGRKGLVAYLT